MNGETDDPWLNTINEPTNNKTIKIGIKKYFFLDLIKLINSIKKDILKLINHSFRVLGSINPITICIYLFFYF